MVQRNNHSIPFTRLPCAYRPFPTAGLSG
jgi:hypothetical protein